MSRQFYYIMIVCLAIIAFTEIYTLLYIELVSQSFLPCQLMKTHKILLLVELVDGTSADIKVITPKYNNSYIMTIYNSFALQIINPPICSANLGVISVRKRIKSIEQTNCLQNCDCLLPQFLCRLRSIATHRDHFVRRPSVCLSVCPSVCHIFQSYGSQATHAFLGMLPIF